MNEWFTLQSLAGLPGQNGTVRGVRKEADREGWKKQKVSFGKGYEYHISSLPKETQRALRIRQTKQQQVAAKQTANLNDAQLKGTLEGMKQSGEEKQQHVQQMAAFNQLSPKEQARVRARIEVLKSLEVYVEDFDSLEQSIREFIEAYNSKQLEL